MESIDDERRIRAVVLDRLRVGQTHVAAGPGDLCALIFGEMFGEELIDSRPALAHANPYNAGTIQVVDDRGVLPAFAIGDFVDTQGDQRSNLVAAADPVNRPVKNVGD